MSFRDADLMREKQRKAEEKKQMEASGVTPPPDNEKEPKKKWNEKLLWSVGRTVVKCKYQSYTSNFLYI